MMMDRSKKGLLVSLALHVLGLALVGYIGVVSLYQPPDDNIYEVAIVGGGGGGGAEAAAAPSQAPQAATEKQADAEDIVEKKEKKPNEPQQVQKPSETPQSTPTPAAKPKAAPAAPAAPAAGSGSGSGSSSSSGSGSGGGSGTGSGGGSGSGSAPQGPGFNTNAVQSDVAPVFRGGSPPAYPAAARNRGISGTVTVQMIVGKGGGVESAYVVGSSGNAALDRAAVNSAYTYSFSPAYKAGYAVRCYYTRSITFRLN